MTTLPFSSTPARAFRLIVVAFVLLLAAAAFTATSAQAAGIVVNDAGDTTGTCSTTGTGTCTLRDAITYANSNAGADTITFNIPSGGACSAANTCTITLGSTLPTITDGVTIDGKSNAASITVDGNHQYRVMLNTSASEVTIDSLTIANGSSGNSSGGGIRNEGATLNVLNSTFTGNSTTNVGGAIYSASSGSTLNVTNITFSDNTAGNGDGGAIFSFGTLNVTNSTISGSTGSGISSRATTTLKNTIVAGSTGINCAHIVGTFTADSHNIATDATCDNATQKTLAEINLQPLADNGGPTQTMALGAGSAAIDTGDDAVCAAAPVNGLDQRGMTRPQGAHCDVGAYEAPVSCPAFPISVANEAELNTAISCYNAETVAGSYTITVTQNISLTSSIAAINNPTSGASLVIAGGNHTIDGGEAPGNPGEGGFVIGSPTTVSITDLTVTGCRQLLTGGAIRNVSGGALTLDNVTLTRNAAGFGGGALSSNAPVTITNSVISDNRNTAIRGGGGILIESPGSLTLIDSEVSDNDTAAVGGGISAESGTSLTIENSLISGNSADTDGGGINLEATATATISNSTIDANPAGTEGGGVKNDGNLTLNQVAVTENTADTSGGGIYNGGTGTLTINQSTVSDNTGTDASATGGGIANVGTLTINNSTVSGNTAHSGGGISNVDGAVSLDSVTIAANTASSTGAGLYTVLSAVTAKNSILADNSGAADCAAVSGGSITDNGYNLVEAPGSCTFSAGTSITGSDPKLGALQDNGGETETHALLPGSPAINAGDTMLTTDQRGQPRPFGPADDIGAYEAQLCDASAWPVSTETELNDAIVCYNAKTVAGSYTISVTQSISLTASTTTINNATSGVALVIEGNGHTVDGQGTSGVRPFTIEDDTTVTLKTMTISGGATQFGGGISNDGTLTILNSTISYNRADSTGGGIDNGGTLYVVNSTVSHNVASNQTNSGLGGGIWNGGTVTVVNSTISDNEAWTSGGGINNVSSSTITLHNSIVANNTAYEFPDCSVTGSVTRSAQNSLVETGTIGDGCLIGSNNLTGDPNLGPLQNNGGPTETHALLPASIAVNAGANALAVDPGGNPLTTDQRGPGFPRIIAGTVDMGAYEFGCPVFPVGVATEGQLNYAITCYNAETVAGSYTIIIAADIDLTASTTTIDNATSGVALVIEGNGHTVDGQGTSGVRPFTIEDDTTVTLKTMTVTGGNTQFGGGISNDGTLTILNSTISYNRADSTGGGIDNGGMLYLVNSTVSHNVASNQTNSGSGGGIWNSGTVTVVNSTISDNEAWTSGGGIDNVSSSTITLHNSIVANNTAFEGPDCFATGSVTRSAQNSLVETDTFGCLNGPNNLTGDPNLGPLQNNGGPTETHALLPGSIAINAGANALAVDPDGNPLPYDQRGPGFLRILGGTVDMGAYETISSPTAVTLSGLEAASQQQAVLAWPWLLALIAAGAALALAGYRRSRA